MTYRRIGVMNDLHIPFHDPRAVDLVLDIFEDSQVDEIAINGDLLDFYGLNQHGPKHPNVIESLEDEFFQGLQFIEQLRDRFPNTKITLVAGNHENRLDRFVLKYCKDFWNFLTVEKMLRLKENHVKYLPYNSFYQIKGTALKLQHSPPSYSENLAMTSLKKKVGGSYIYGCSHRVQHAVKNIDGGGVCEVWANGWLGSTTLTASHREVFSYTKGHEEWQQAAGIITANSSTGHFFYEQFLLKDYNVCINGAVYEG